MMNTELPDLRAVVFDLDGLMFNTEDLYDEVGDIILRRRGHRFTPQLKDKMMGRPGKIALQIMIDDHDLEATIVELESECDEIFVDLLPARLAPLTGLLRLLDALEAAEIRKAIATSSRRVFTERVLSQFDFEPRFEFLLTAEDVQQGKPHPEIYQAAARRMDLPADKIMVLEDSQNGCRAAIDAGTFAIAVPSSHSAHHNFDGAAAVVESLESPAIYAALKLG